MNTEVEAAFNEMLDISQDIDKAVLFSADEVLASNMDVQGQATAVNQALELIALGEERAQDMGSQPLTQLVVEVASGFVFIAREVDEGGMVILATGEKNSRVGLVLYDLKTCLRDAREALAASQARMTEEGN